MSCTISTEARLAKLWLTYAWADNQHRDVDFFAQELKAIGLDVRLDRWNISAGKRLWEQISVSIQDPAECDAWVLYATQNSLGSEACKEELAYALDRALSVRGEKFPIIGFFPSSINATLIPAPLKVRLYLTARDPDWRERIKAATEHRSPAIYPGDIDPFEIKLHRLPKQFLIEVRPRAGIWTPFLAAIPITEKDNVKPELAFGPSGRPPGASMISVRQPRPSLDGNMWVLLAENEANPTHSYFVVCESLPTALVFGSIDGPKFKVETAKLQLS
jgi:TIR domain